MAGYVANADVDYTAFSPTFNHGYPGSSLIGGTVGFFKDLIQGACSGGMTFVGVMNTIGADLAILPHLPLEKVISSALASEPLNTIIHSSYAGFVEIAIGAALFLTARRGIARTIGLLGIILYITAVATGIDLSGLTQVATNVVESAQAGWEHFQSAQSASSQ